MVARAESGTCCPCTTAASVVCACLARHTRRTTRVWMTIYVYLAISGPGSRAWRDVQALSKASGSWVQSSDGLPVDGGCSTRVLQDAAKASLSRVVDVLEAVEAGTGDWRNGWCTA